MNEKKLWETPLNLTVKKINKTMSCPIRCYAPLPPLSTLIHTCMFLMWCLKVPTDFFVMTSNAFTGVLYATVQSGHTCVIKEARYRLRTVIQVSSASASSPCIWELLNSLSAVILLRKCWTEQLHLLKNKKWYSWDRFLYSNMNVYVCWTDSFCWIRIRRIYIRLLDTLLCSVRILRFHGDKARFILYHNPHL